MINYIFFNINWEYFLYTNNIFFFTFTKQNSNNIFIKEQKCIVNKFICIGLEESMVPFLK